MAHNFSSVYSVDGKMLAVVHMDSCYRETFIATYNSSTTCTQPCQVPEGHIIPPICAHGDFLQFATVKSGYITYGKLISP